ncbi:MAG: hypothetical protein NWR54_00375, partial [Paracoccaceae bacterium]|nr:hypothetical protein [Paracoccaceae bacterium]
MKILGFALAGTTALIMTTAAADQNEAFLLQTGDNHSAQITQSGDKNKAGAATPTMTQDGENNQLVILQSGDRNKIGLEGGGVYQDNPYDNGSLMRIDITQSSDRNVVGSVMQSTDDQNEAGSGNSVDITQSGWGRNRVGYVKQIQSGTGNNQLDVRQSGWKDQLETVTQTSNVAAGTPNRITVRMNGVSNGTGGLGFFASETGAESSTLRQGNINPASQGNSITLNVTGTGNDFGVTQNGNDNTVGTLNLGGTLNDLGILQTGDSNTVSMASVSGIANVIGVKQIGNINMASVSVSGTLNQFGVAQLGNSNEANVTVTGVNNGLAPSLWSTANWSGAALIVASAN